MNNIRFINYVFACMLVATISCGFCAQGKGGECIKINKQVSIQRPVWNKGDSWRVKCPVYGYSQMEIEIRDYYTLVVEVLDNETARGEKCYVLKISSQPDFAKRGGATTDERYESYVYYRVTDLTIKRIRTDHWRNGSLAQSDTYALPGATAFGIEVMYPTMPIVLPQFPLADSGSVMRHHKQFGSVDDPKAKADPEYYDKLVVSTTIYVVSTPGVTSRDAPSIASRGSIKGAVTADFVRTDEYKSGDLTQRVLTQVWAPGHKWWILARLGDRDPRSIGAYILLE